MGITHTSLGTSIESKAIIKSAHFDVYDIINETEEVKGEIEAICRYKGVSAADYISKLPEVSQALKGIFKDSEVRAIREIEKLYPVTNDKTDPEIKYLRFFADLAMEYFVSVFHTKMTEYSEEGKVIETTEDPYVSVQPVQLTDKVVSI